MTPSTPVEEAIALVVDGLRPLPVVRPAPDQAIGGVLAEDVVSTLDLPPFGNSAMDGFVLRAADTAGASGDAPARLRLTGESRAGTPAGATLEPGCAMRISTGAAMPDGADAVLRVEDSAIDGDELLVSAPLETGKDVRPAGDDVIRGQTVLEAGAIVGVGELAMLASVGATEVAVHRRPRVALMATGDELKAPGEQLGHGQIYDSNSFMLAELVRESGAELGAVNTRVADTQPAVDAALADCLREADVLVICGGVSKGEHDHVKPALADAGVEQVFWQVALRPGHPAWFGIHKRPDGSETLVFGLPGNPVSAFVTFHLFVRPALAALAGDRREPLRLQARFRGAHQHKKRGFTHAVRCTLRNDGEELVAELTSGNQRSHAMTSMVGADALAVLPAEAECLDDGDIVTVRLLRR